MKVFGSKLNLAIAGAILAVLCSSPMVAAENNQQQQATGESSTANRTQGDQARSDMEQLKELLKAHPASSELVKRAECIKACACCAMACGVCADACLDEDNVAELRKCIRMGADCAKVCATTVCVLSGAGEKQIIRSQVESAKAAAQATAKEMEKHAEKIETCRLAAEACRKCVKACEKMLQKMQDGQE